MLIAGGDQRQQNDVKVAYSDFGLFTLLFSIFLPRKAAMLARSWDRNYVCPSICLLSLIHI